MTEEQHSEEPSPACEGTKGGIDRSNLPMTLRVSAFLLITLMDNPLSNSSSNITKGDKGTELIQQVEKLAFIV